MAGANAFSPLSASCHNWADTFRKADDDMRVLLVEDDPILGSAVRDQVAADGHGVDWAKRLADADAFVRLAHYDLILLDLMLPDGRGLDFLRSRRQAGDTTAVIILTARDQVSDRIAGLNAGADDYLVKPFDLAELSARLSAVARRYGGNPNPLMQIGRLTLDLAARSIVRDGRSISLTAREWALFDAFIQRPTMLLSKALLEERLYTFDSEVESNTIEVYVGRLRKKLGADVIETVRGMGYRLGAATLAGTGKSPP
jgi:two-component system OmpR family response regulator